MDNQNKIWLPLNSITEKIWYTDDETKNMRVIVSALTEHPLAWTVTKVENISPLGLQKLTLYQNVWNDNTDYVNFETGEMYANYYDFEVEPSDRNDTIITPVSQSIKISASTPTLKVGGSYKTLTANLNDSEEDILYKYPNATFTWTCLIDTEDWTDKVIWRESTSKNQIKLKFPSDRSQLGKLLDIKCVVSQDKNILSSIPFQLELVE